ncbi:MAG: glycosyltransferase family 2 protein [Candidatus Kapaibacterium sp.]
MQISIVIVNYNVCDLLLNAVASVYVALEGIEGEIIVVDNASTDGAIDMLNRIYPDVITVPLDRNLGFGAANNIGIEMARGEYILLLNPDTVVEEGTLRTMLDFMAEYRDAVFAGCKIILPNGSIDPVSKRGFPSPWSSFCRVFGLSRLFPKSKFFGGYNLTYMDAEQVARIDALAGCFMFCRAPQLKSLGGFDTDFFMYGEDLDLCYRAKKAGGEIYYCPSTSIMHFKGESTRRSSIDALAVFYEAMEIFARKHFRSNPPLLLLIRLGIWVRRAVARMEERFPGIGMAPVDIAAALVGFMIGSTIKFGGPFAYPSYALLTVIILPPLIFVLTLAIIGGYSMEDRTPGRALLGYLFGFFALSTLPYFFKDYAFSRGVVLLTTGFGAFFGVLGRFLWLLYRRTYGAESIRRIAFLSRQEISPGIRQGVRRMFFTRPVAVVGSIAPTFSEVAAIGEGALGTVENIGKIVREFRITDIVVLDANLSYSEVLRAMASTASLPVRYHIIHGALETSGELIGGAEAAVAPSERSGGAHVARWLRDRVVAFGGLLFLIPFVYLSTRRPGFHIRRLWDVLRGKRALVGSGAMAGPEDSAPMFSMAAIYREGTLTQRELAQIDAFYLSNQSFLLDCEILIAIVRQRNLPVVASASVSGRV